MKGKLIDEEARAEGSVTGSVYWTYIKSGGGIVALYGLILVWSGLIYFKGEEIARITPIGGRLFAALAVTVGVSGALGIANLQTAGDLGLVVGSALSRTFGAGIGFPILLMLMLLGVHLAGLQPTPVPCAG